MSRNNICDAQLSNPIIVKGKKDRIGIFAGIAATFTVSRDFPPTLFLSLNSAQNINLPANEQGLQFTFVNTSGGAFTGTFKDSDGTTTRGTIAQNAVARAVSDGTRWWIG